VTAPDRDDLERRLAEAEDQVLTMGRSFETLAAALAPLGEMAAVVNELAPEFARWAETIEAARLERTADDLQRPDEL
jgi:hypothetical protein